MTPTEVTLYALLQHNHDQPDYGVPPVNFFPAQVPRNNAYGYTDAQPQDGDDSAHRRRVPDR